MSERRVKVLAWGSWLFMVACAAVSIVFTVLSWDSPVPPSAFGPRGFESTPGAGTTIAGRIPVEVTR